MYIVIVLSWAVSILPAFKLWSQAGFQITKRKVRTGKPCPELLQWLSFDCNLPHKIPQWVSLFLSLVSTLYPHTNRRATKHLWKTSEAFLSWASSPLCYPLPYPYMSPILCAPLPPLSTSWPAETFDGPSSPSDPWQSNLVEAPVAVVGSCKTFLAENRASIAPAG
jgi:hypothetical protein